MDDRDIARVIFDVASMCGLRIRSIDFGDVRIGISIGRASDYAVVTLARSMFDSYASATRFSAAAEPLQNRPSLHSMVWHEFRQVAIDLKSG